MSISQGYTFCISIIWATFTTRKALKITFEILDVLWYILPLSCPASGKCCLCKNPASWWGTHRSLTRHKIHHRNSGKGFKEPKIRDQWARKRESEGSWEQKNPNPNPQHKQQGIGPTFDTVIPTAWQGKVERDDLWTMFNGQLLYLAVMMSFLECN